MKRYLPFLLILLIFACSQPAHEEIPFTIIKGKITFNPLEDRPDRADFIEERRKIGLISDAIRSGLEVPNHNAKTDENGNYHFLIKIDQPTEVRLMHHYRFNLPIWVNPGDEVLVDIDYTMADSIPLSPFIISGDNQAINLKMAQFDQLFNDSFRVELNATLPYVIPREFKTQRAKMTDRIQAVTKNFIVNHANNNPILANWVQNHADYRLGMDYMKYAFKTYGRGQYSAGIKEGFPEAYFDFWETYPIDQPTAITSLNYQNYLQFYRKYLMARLAETAPYQDCKNFPNCNHYELELEQITNNLSGKIKDILVAQQIDYRLLRNDVGFIKTGFQPFIKAIEDSTLVQQINNRKAFLYEKKTFNFPRSVNLYQTSGLAPEIIQTINQQRLKEQPTILYFWNTQTPITWSFAPKADLKDVWLSIDSLGFNLVLLAHHSTPNSWKEKIIDLGLVNDNWHLTDEQFDYFENYFNDNRQPHVWYDRIYDKENFMLVLEESGQLNTMNSISFRESSSVALQSLPRRLKWIQEQQKRKRITAQ